MPHAPATTHDDAPVVDRYIRLLHGPFRERTALLAVCPNSETVARAALHAAKETGAPMLFAATLNQVDLDGGYTGRTPAELTAFLRAEADAIGLETPVLACLDHGGPWLKDAHTTAGLGLEETMAAVKRSYEACIDAGYALLHVDPTVDRTLAPGTPMPIETVVERTLELIAHAEAYRARRGAPRIAYEVGTEEVHGGLADLTNFDAFLDGLDRGLRDRGLEHAWPCFVVGKVGTDLHTTYFEPDVARRLTERVRSYGALVKGHYTDYVDNPRDYPLSGMGGANVGPEFTEVEYEALADLVRLERRLDLDSGLERAIRDALVASGRWEKWRQPDEEGLAFDALSPERRRWMLRTGSRYVWTRPDVAAARARLFEHVADHADGPAYVLWRVKSRILHYAHAFNLVGFAERARAADPALDGR